MHSKTELSEENNRYQCKLLCFLLLAILLSCDSGVGDRPKGDYELVWSQPKKSTSLSAPTAHLDGRNAFFVSGNELVKIDLSSQEKMWSKSISTERVDFIGHLYGDENVVFAYDLRSSISAFDKEDGELIWTSGLSQYSVSPFAELIDNKDEYLLPVKDGVVSIYKETGRLQKRLDLDRAVSNGALQTGHYGDVSDNDMCVPATYIDTDDNLKGVLVLINLLSFEIIWQYKIPKIEAEGITFYQSAESCSISENVVTVVSSGRMTGLDRRSGNMKWDRIFDIPNTQNRDGFAPGPISSNETHVFAGSTGQKVYSIRSENGNVDFVSPVKYSLTDQKLAVFDNQVIAVDARLWIFDGQNGDLIYNYRIPEEINDDILSWPAVSDEWIFVTGFKNHYAFSNRN